MNSFVLLYLIFVLFVFFMRTEFYIKKHIKFICKSFAAVLLAFSVQVISAINFVKGSTIPNYVIIDSMNLKMKNVSLMHLESQKLLVTNLLWYHTNTKELKFGCFLS